jgi:hypothetical protein
VKSTREPSAGACRNGPGHYHQWICLSNRNITITTEDLKKERSKSSKTAPTPTSNIADIRRSTAEPRQYTPEPTRTIVDSGRSVAGSSGKGCGGVIAILSLIFFAIKGCLSTPNHQVSSVTSSPSAADGEDVDVRRAEPVAESTPPLTPFESASAQLLYSVVGVAPGDALNVHSEPGSTNSITARLRNGYSGITIIGAPVMNDTTEWVNINFRGGSGWVNRAYLKAD